MKVERVPVLVVGGAYTGLTAALGLAARGVHPVLVERRSGTATLPKAWGLTTRTRELLGMLPTVARRLTVAIADTSQLFYTSSGASLADPQRRAHPVPTEPNPADISPSPEVQISQAQVEEILRVSAEESGADLRFGVELICFTQDEKKVTATLQEVSTGRTHLVEADYMIAADGSKSCIRDALGIATEGPGTIGHTFIITFEADLSRYAKEGAFEVISIPGSGSSLLLDGSKQHTLWVDYHPEHGQTPQDFTEELSLQRVHRAVGDSTIEVTFVNARSFSVSHKLAERFREGRVFLAGDSAHTCPPVGGQGGNLAIQDAYDLSWRIAMVHTRQATDKLLDTYEADRRPIINTTLKREVTLYRHSEGKALGSYDPSDPNNPLPTPMEDLGFRYRSRAILNEATSAAAPQQEDPWQPSGRPGTRAPHVALNKDTQEFSTYDLFGRRFVLLTGPKGTEWQIAAEASARKLGIDLDIHRIGDRILDTNNLWCERYGVDPAGACLIRPDAVIAWRNTQAAKDPQRELTAALTAVLAR